MPQSLRAAILAQQSGQVLAIAEEHRIGGAQIGIARTRQIDGEAFADTSARAYGCAEEMPVTLRWNIPKDFQRATRRRYGPAKVTALLTNEANDADVIGELRKSAIDIRECA